MSRGGKKHKNKGNAKTVDAITTADAMTAAAASAISMMVTARINAALSDGVASAVETVVEKMVKESVEATLKVALKARTGDVTAAVTTAVLADIKAELSKRAAEAVLEKMVNEAAVADAVPAAIASHPLPQLPLEEQSGHNNQEKIYAFYNPEHGCRRSLWMEIDPHYSGPLKDADENHRDCFAVDSMTIKLNPPPHIDLYRITDFATVAADSKVYFIGGRYINEHVDDYDYDHVPVISDKMFIYHLSSNKWEESPSKLNIARGHHEAVVVPGAGASGGKFIYVFGGYSSGEQCVISKKHWVEYCDLRNSELAWEFLPPSGSLTDFDHECYFVYEHGSQVVFRKPSYHDNRDFERFRSFNYVSRTWGPFDFKYQPETSCKVAVVDHIVYWYDRWVIHGYHLIKNQLVLKQRLNELKLSSGSWGGREQFLVSIGNDTLILMLEESGYLVETKFHFYKLQIVKLSSDGSNQEDSCAIRLVQIGAGIFSLPIYYFQDAVLVLKQ